MLLDWEFLQAIEKETLDKIMTTFVTKVEGHDVFIRCHFDESRFLSISILILLDEYRCLRSPLLQYGCLVSTERSICINSEDSNCISDPRKKNRVGLDF